MCSGRRQRILLRLTYRCGRSKESMTEAPGTEPIEVLMIDGKPGEARLIETWLANVDRGFEISYAGGLGEALDELELADFDAILLELSRADSSGLETVEQLCTAFP